MYRSKRFEWRLRFTENTEYFRQYGLYLSATKKRNNDTNKHYTWKNFFKGNDICDFQFKFIILKGYFLLLKFSLLILFH